MYRTLTISIELLSISQNEQILVSVIAVFFSVKGNVDIDHDTKAVVSHDALSDVEIVPYSNTLVGGTFGQCVSVLRFVKTSKSIKTRQVYS